jgi:selenocysteine lyase/cysteine desulfurase
MPLNSTAVATLRAEFPALQQTEGGRPLIFLDGPGGTQVHSSVIKAMRRYFTEANSNTHGVFLHSRRTDETVTEARCALADFLNAPRPEEIVFGPNMTTSSGSFWTSMIPADSIATSVPLPMAIPTPARVSV